MRNDLENLRDFMGGYFHQDWNADLPDVRTVLSHFRKSAGSEEIDQICLELNIVLKEAESHPITDEFMLEELFCYYWPGRDNMTNIEFLKLTKKELGCK